MTEDTVKDRMELRIRRESPLATRTDLSSDAVRDIAPAMNAILADVFALYLKTKNFHWHMSGPHFRDYHLLLDEQADQIYAMTDPIAERIRKIGGATLKSIGHIARTQRVLDNERRILPLKVGGEHQLVAPAILTSRRFLVFNEPGQITSSALFRFWPRYHAALRCD